MIGLSNWPLTRTPCCTRLVAELLLTCRPMVCFPTTLTFGLDWPTGEDLGAYVTTDPLDAAGIVGVADDGGEGAHPETSGPVDLAPGTYFIGILNFSESNPPFFTLTIN